MKHQKSNTGRAVRWSVLLLALSLAGLGAASPQPKAPPAQEVGREAKQAVQTRVATQKELDAWADERSTLADAIEAAQKELKLVTAQRTKAQAYLAGQKAKVAELERRLAETERIRRELEPFLDRETARLAATVGADLPFLATERAKRLAALQHSLNDYDASLANKAAGLLNALEVEARYGLTVSVEETELDIQGARHRVRLLRLGRLALFALDPSGRRAWRWDRQSRQWKAQDTLHRELEMAAEIAQRRRVVSLVELPVGLAPAAPEAK
jgi:septal ring factor EnvC (AmiA/AmiB activator)